MKQILTDNWSFRQALEPAWHEAIVPGSVYSNSLRLNLIPSPYWRENEYQVLDLSEKDYEFMTTFNVEEPLWNERSIELVFEGLDTLTTLVLNGTLLGETNNMHRSYTFDIKHLLKKEGNTLLITFHSPLEFYKKMQAIAPIYTLDQSISGMSHLRKSHCMSGWDWGPQLPDMGIWKDVYLVGHSSGIIDDVEILQNHYADRVDVTVNTYFNNLSRDGLEVRYFLHSDTTEVISCTHTLTNTMDTATLQVTSPNLWWPNGYGDHPLYQLEVQLVKDGIVVDQVQKKIGLRTLTVRREKDQWGESFEFVINGKAIFAMGGNYIPEDSLLVNITYERTKTFIENCVAANMNCIRVWGGGFYPMDYFYELCDEMGMIIWQDLMFACAMYRMTDEFTENITVEVTQQLKRIRHHACLGLVCGNNEIEIAFSHWEVFTNSPPEFKEDYVKQFEVLLPEIAQQVAPQVFYWKSSPSSGGHFDHAGDENRGDVHEWAVWHGTEPFTYFQNHYYRFLSEFGIQSYPSYKTIKSFTLPEDRNIFSPVMESHQKNGAGNGKILHYIGETYAYPKTFEHVVYASQLIQGEGISYAVEHLRRNRGRCMGALYWQLNDCWPVASWSSVDYDGRWKALHYMAKRFFNPVLISAKAIKRDVSNQELPQSQRSFPISLYTGAQIAVTNDSFKALNGTVVICLRNNRSEILWEKNIEIALEPLSVFTLETLDFSDYLTTRELARSTYLEFSMIQQGMTLSTNTLLFVKPKHFQFIAPLIGYTIIENEEQFEITLTSESYAQYVHLDLTDTDTVFSDNFFHMNAHTPYRVTCKKNGLSLKDLKGQLTLQSIFDIGK